VEQARAVDLRGAGSRVGPGGGAGWRPLGPPGANRERRPGVKDGGLGAGRERGAPLGRGKDNLSDLTFLLIG
jgi:hypothetical protein